MISTTGSGLCFAALGERWQMIALRFTLTAAAEFPLIYIEQRNDARTVVHALVA